MVYNFSQNMKNSTLKIIFPRFALFPTFSNFSICVILHFQQFFLASCNIPRQSEMVNFAKIMRDIHCGGFVILKWGILNVDSFLSSCLN